MRDIDLIPASYRKRQRQKRQLIVAGTVLVSVVVICVAGRLSLNYLTAKVNQEIQTLQVQQTMTTQQRDQLAAFQTQRKDAAQQLHLLQGLRSGTAAENLFRIIDQVLIPNEVWFVDWQFRRAGVAQGEVRTSQPGYFVIASDSASTDPWVVETHMKISGQARDHVALSEFVQRLVQERAIRDVRVRNTSLRRFTLETVVDFDLAIVINSAVVDT
jgi:hypothetical protein